MMMGTSEFWINFWADIAALLAGMVGWQIWQRIRARRGGRRRDDAA